MAVTLQRKIETSHTQAVVFLVLTALLWSMGGLLIKFIAWNPLAIAGGRSAIAALIMLLFIRKFHFSFNKYLIGGALAYAATVILFVTSTKLTTAANAILLQYTAPIYIALIGTWLLKERTTLLDWATILMVLGGMVLFFIKDLAPGGLLGNILAITSGISFALITVFLRKQKDASPIDSIFWGNILTALIGLPFMTGGFPDGPSLIGLLILGVFQLGISYILFATAIKEVTALEATLITVLEPVLNPIWVLLAFGEKPGLLPVLGGVIIVLAVTVRGIIINLAELKKHYHPEFTSEQGK